MEKKLDLTLGVLTLAIILLFISTLLLYNSLDKSLDFLYGILQCTSQEQIEQSSLYYNKEIES